MKVLLESGYCKLTTAFGRLRYYFRLPKVLPEVCYLERHECSNSRVSKIACYLNFQVEQTSSESMTGDMRLGVDLGINNIAASSDNALWESGPIKVVKGKYQYLSSRLQSKSFVE